MAIVTFASEFGETSHLVIIQNFELQFLEGGGEEEHWIDDFGAKGFVEGKEGERGGKGR